MDVRFLLVVYRCLPRSPYLQKIYGRFNFSLNVYCTKQYLFDNYRENKEQIYHSVSHYAPVKNISTVEAFTDEYLTQMMDVSTFFYLQFSLPFFQLLEM